MIQAPQYQERLVADLGDTELDMDSLHFIFAKILPLFDNYSLFVLGYILAINPKIGQKRKIHHEDCIDLVLIWILCT